VDRDGRNLFNLEEVSRLAGHSRSEITARHYAKWIPSRQRRLQEKVRRQWEDEGKIVPIRSSKFLA